MSKFDFSHSMTKSEIIKHILKKILFFIFFFTRREIKKGQKNNEK